MKPKRKKTWGWGEEYRYATIDRIERCVAVFVRKDIAQRAAARQKLDTDYARIRGPIRLVEANE